MASLDILKSSQETGHHFHSHLHFQNSQLLHDLMTCPCYQILLPEIKGKREDKFVQPIKCSCFIIILLADWKVIDYHCFSSGLEGVIFIVSIAAG